MLRPSYSDLLAVLNKDAENENVVNSRYTIVIAAAKRARELVDHEEPLTMNYNVDKPVSIAVRELYEGKLAILQNFETQTADQQEEQREQE